jgi:hypothetical protein
VRAAAGRPGLVIGFLDAQPWPRRAPRPPRGADYIGFGPVFGTRSKAEPGSDGGLDALAEVCRAVAVPWSRSAASRWRPWRRWRAPAPPRPR